MVERRASTQGPYVPRVPIALACTICKSRNYRTTKKREQIVEMKKFCKICGAHTLHRETK